MSNFIRRTKNPETGKFQDAEWLDNYYGPRQYGVRFLEANGEISIYQESDHEWEFDDPSQSEQYRHPDTCNTCGRWHDGREWCDQDQELDELVRDLTKVHPLPKSVVRKRLLEWREAYVRQAEIRARIDQLDKLIDIESKTFNCWTQKDIANFFDAVGKQYRELEQQLSLNEEAE